MEAVRHWQLCNRHTQTCIHNTLAALEAFLVGCPVRGSRGLSMSMQYNFDDLPCLFLQRSRYQCHLLSLVCGEGHCPLQSPLAECTDIEHHHQHVAITTITANILEENSQAYKTEKENPKQTNKNPSFCILLTHSDKQHYLKKTTKTMLASDHQILP